MNKKVKVKTPTTTDQTVITYNGTKAPKNKCVSIGGLYYVLGDRNIKDSGDCYDIDGTKYRVVSGKLIWSYDEERYVVKNDNMNFIIYNNEQMSIKNPSDLMFKTNQLLFQLNPNNYARTYILKEDLFKKDCLFAYDFATGYADLKGNIKLNSPKNFGGKPTYAKINTQVYSLSEHPLKDEFNILFKQELSKYYKKSLLSKYLPYKYGLEIETDTGFLPESFYLLFNCLPLKDGSILGTEITTNVFDNNTVDTSSYIYKMMKEVCYYTRASKNNSLHVNIGNVKNTPLFRVALYNLYLRLEHELEISLVPIYKRDVGYLATKQGGPKDHCKPLMPLFDSITTKENLDKFIEDADQKIFTLFNNGVKECSESNRKNRQHSAPNAPKWDHFGRYHTLNLEHLYFGSQNASRVEYRVHSGTVNPIKTLLWTVITSAITKYAEENAVDILTLKQKITLEDVLANVIDNESLFRFIMAYINSRKVINIERKIAGNYTCNDEFTNDHTYDFKFSNLTVETFLSL